MTIRFYIILKPNQTKPVNHTVYLKAPNWRVNECLNFHLHRWTELSSLSTALSSVRISVTLRNPPLTDLSAIFFFICDAYWPPNPISKSTTWTTNGEDNWELSESRIAWFAGNFFNRLDILNNNGPRILICRIFFFLRKNNLKMRTNYKIVN